MKTTLGAQLANVVNASVTMFFHSVQRLRAPPTGAGPVDGRTSAPCLRARFAPLDPPLDLVHLSRQCLGDRELETELLGIFRLQAPALTAQLSGSPCLSLDAKAQNRSHAAGLGARRWGGPGRRRSLANRGIGFRRGRSKLGGGAGGRRAPLRSGRGGRGNRPDPGLVGTTVDRDASAFSSRSANHVAGGRYTSNALSAPPCLLYVGALYIAGARRSNSRSSKA